MTDNLQDIIKNQGINSIIHQKFIDSIFDGAQYQVIGYV